MLQQSDATSGRLLSRCCILYQSLREISTKGMHFGQATHSVRACHGLMPRVLNSKSGYTSSYKTTRGGMLSLRPG